MRIDVKGTDKDVDEFFAILGRIARRLRAAESEVERLDGWTKLLMVEKSELVTEVERLRDYQTEKYDELADALTEYRAALERIAKEPHRGITIRVDAENMRSYARAALAKEEA